MKEIKQYQKKWLQHVQRMDTNRLPKVATTCTEDGHKHVQRMDTNRLPKVATKCTEDGYKQTTKSAYKMHRGWIQTDYQNKHCSVNQKDEGT